MPEIPEVVRFHFARQAPSPWNWYTKSEFAGCILKWTPVDAVVSYTVFRCTESLPGDCCEDLLNGSYDDVVDRVDIFKPIHMLVDDEIHDRNRYLVLAHLENDDIVWVRDVESEQYGGEQMDEPLTFWSNPFGDTPKIKDPCRLDYSTVRVGTFCGFEWDYPDGYPDFTGYELIICDVPYSPHTGADSDIEAFREVLSGTRGVHFQLDRFVTAIVDNESFVNRFWYYALLVCLPEGGRVQIPMRHVETAFPAGKPFQYLGSRNGWGEGRERMMAAYAKWKAQASSRTLQPTGINTPAAVEDDSNSPSVQLEFFRHAPDLSLESYRNHPDMIGIQFSARVPENATVIAIRSVVELDAAKGRETLERAVQNNGFADDDTDAFVFTPKTQYMVMVDPDCHKKSCYAFALYDKENQEFEPLEHVKDVTIDYLDKPESVIRWGDDSLTFRNRLVHVLKIEEIQKKSIVSIEFGIVDESIVNAIELYRFNQMPQWDEDNLDQLYQLEQNGNPAIGDRFVIGHMCHGVIDDVSRCNQNHFYAAVLVDRFGNRKSISLFNVGNQEREGWDRLSDIVGVKPVSDDEPLEEEIPEEEVDSGKKRSDSRSWRHRYSWDDDDSAASPKSSDSPALTRSSGAISADSPSVSGESGRVSRRRFNWDDDDSAASPKSSDSPALTRSSGSISAASSSVSPSVSGESGRVSRRRFNWDDDDSAASPKSSESPALTRSSGAISAVSPSVSGESSRVSGESGRVSRRRFSWDDDDSAASTKSSDSPALTRSSGSISAASSSVSPSVSGESGRVSGESGRVSRRRFNWDDDDSAASPKSSESPALTRSSGAISAASSSVSSSVSGESSRVSGESGRASRRRFSWDDDDSAASTKSSDSPALTRSSGAISAASSSVSPSVSGESSRVSGESGRASRRRFSWDDDSAASTKSSDSPALTRSSGVISAASSSVSPSVSGESSRVSGESGRASRRRFNWDDDDSAASTKSSDSPALMRSSGAISAASSSVSPSLSGESSRVSGESGRASRRRFSWDDDDSAALPKSSESPALTRSSGAISAASSSVSPSVSGESGRVSGESGRASRRRFSWDDDDSAASPKSSESPALTRSSGVISAASSSVSPSVSGESSRVSGESGRASRRRFHWDDDDSAASTKSSESPALTRPSGVISAASSSVSPSLSGESGRVGRRRYKWQDEEQAELSSGSVSSVSSSVSPSLSGESGRVGRRRYKWQDEEQVETKSQDNRIQPASSASSGSEEIVSPKRKKRRFSWDEEEAQAADQNPASSLSAAQEPVITEDERILEILSKCRQTIQTGDVQTASVMIERARQDYGRNLRIDAFAWNYLRQV